MDDAAIVELYWARNEDAIVQTQQKYGPYCRAIARNILSSPEDAEECVSDTWYNAWNAMPPQRPDSLSAFLGRIVRNLSISRWRREKAQKRYAGLEAQLSELEDCLPAPAGVEEAVEGKELTALLERWLEGLEQEERVLFLRRYWYGVPVKDLAKVRGMGANQMAKRLLRLRKDLKGFLEREGYGV